MENDPYVYPGTDVLQNSFNEHDPDRLRDKEQEATALAMLRLLRDPVKGRFDAAHLKEIHRRIFETVYPFAGQNRTIELTKPEIALNGRSVAYGDPEKLDELLDYDTTALNRFRWNDTTIGRSAAEFGKMVANVWQAHPFREGNTRAVMIFMHQFAKEHDFELDRSSMDRYPPETRDNFAKATAGDAKDLIRMFVIARTTMIERGHPKLGRTSSDTNEVLRLLRDPPIDIPTPGRTVSGTVLVRNYNQVLVHSSKGVAVLDLANFAEAPQNNDRVTVPVTHPFEKSVGVSAIAEPSRTVKVAPPRTDDKERGR